MENQSVEESKSLNKTATIFEQPLEDIVGPNPNVSVSRRLMYEALEYALKKQISRIRKIINECDKIEHNNELLKKPTKEQIDKKQKMSATDFYYRFDMIKLIANDPSHFVCFWYIILYNRLKSPFCNRKQNQFIFNELGNKCHPDVIYTFIYKHFDFLTSAMQELVMQNNLEGLCGLYFARERKTSFFLVLIGLVPEKFDNEGKILSVDRWVHICDNYEYVGKGLGTQAFNWYRDNIFLPSVEKGEFAENAIYTSKTLLNNIPSLSFQQKLFSLTEKTYIKDDCQIAEGTIDNLYNFAKTSRQINNAFNDDEEEKGLIKIKQKNSCCKCTIF
jgi:hypothetical protein